MEFNGNYKYKTYYMILQWDNLLTLSYNNFLTRSDNCVGSNLFSTFQKLIAFSRKFPINDWKHLLFFIFLTFSTKLFSHHVTLCKLGKNLDLNHILSFDSMPGVDHICLLIGALTVFAMHFVCCRGT